MNDKKPVCIIEDNKSIRKLFATLLIKSGFAVEEFDSALPAIEWIKSNLPDVVIADILLPDLNGTEVLKMIRLIPNGNSIVVIAVTGFAQGNDREKLLELGFDHYISKPIHTSTFIEEIKKIIQSKII